MNRLESYEAAITAQLAVQPSMTLQPLRDWLKENYTLGTSVSAVARFVRQIGYRYKETVYASEQQRDDVAHQRQNWKVGRCHCDASRLVFLDETSVSTDMVRRYGRALGGARCRDAAPLGHW